MSSILIIDEQDRSRLKLAHAVQSSAEWVLAGAVGCLQEGLRLIASLRPEIVITDLSLPDSTGTATLQAVVTAQAGRRTLVFTELDELRYGEEALSLGADGYMMKHVSVDDVLRACTALIVGGVWLSPALAVRIMHRKVSGPIPTSAPPADLSLLSIREQEILALLGSGRTTKEIASLLELSSRTVDIHRANIKRKLGLRTGAELMSFASRQSS